MPPALEVAKRPHEDIRRSPSPSEDLVGKPAAAPLPLSAIGHDDQDVEIAVGPTVPPRARTEEMEALRLVAQLETIDDLVELRLVHHTAHFNSHSGAPAQISDVHRPVPIACKNTEVGAPDPENIRRNQGRPLPRGPRLTQMPGINPRFEPARRNLESLRADERRPGATDFGRGDVRGEGFRSRAFAELRAGA